MEQALFTTEGLLGNLLPSGVGKVRDIYDLGKTLLIVATDRISTFDVVHPTAISGKGRALTQLTLHWLNVLKAAWPHHLITADINAFLVMSIGPCSMVTYRIPPDQKEHLGDVLHTHKDILEGRSMLVKKAQVVPVECVVRGYLYGSGWRDYQESGTVCGIRLPTGLREADRLENPIFTPATKAPSGTHDVNITEEEAKRLVGKEVFQTIKDRSLELYLQAANYARERRVIIADTKFEFGFQDGQIILIDEVLTPDSSRFWPAELWEPGKPQPSFDKQFVRDYGDSIGWDHKPPAPELPPNIITATQQRYQEALKRLTAPM